MSKNQSLPELAHRSTKFYVVGKLDYAIGDVYYMCSCPQFGKHAYCKHSLGCSIAAKKVLVPPNLDITKVGAKKRGRGRPAAIGGPLVR